MSTFSQSEIDALNADLDRIWRSLPWRVRCAYWLAHRLNWAWLYRVASQILARAARQEDA